MKNLNQMMTDNMLRKPNLTPRQDNLDNETIFNISVELRRRLLEPDFTHFIITKLDDLQAPNA